MQSGHGHSPALLYGAISWKGTACPFTSNAIRLDPPDGWGIGPPSVCFWLTGSDQMVAGVSGHVSTNTCHSKEETGESYQA